MFEKFKKYRFLFEELVKRDFKKKYKRTVLGMLWSLISPLLQLMVLVLVFQNFFGKTTENYIIYVFSGTVVFLYFSDATQGGMRSLLSNASIFSKVDVPKYMFLLSRNIQALLNFGLSLIIYFVLAAVSGIHFHFYFLMLIFPIICLMVYNIGVGMILSALFVSFRDVEYLYSVFVMLLQYMSAIFYTVDSFSEKTQMMFYFNPVYAYINYFRKIVIKNEIPSFRLHVLCAFYALLMLSIGAFVYKKNNYKFLYYV